jgi:kynurenine formamidase
MDLDKLEWMQSRYGRSDRIGAANNILPETILRAISLVRSGTAVSLAVDVGPDSPTFHPRSSQVIVTQSSGSPRSTKGRNCLCGNDDMLITSCGIGTHIDGLGHIGVDNVFYNGLKAEEIVRRDGLLELGTEGIPPLIGRGLLLDFPSLLDIPFLEPGQAINSGEIAAACNAQDLEIAAGDIVLLHTGWLSAMADAGQDYVHRSPGLGIDGASYLAERSVVAIGADNAALEVLPSEDPTLAYPVHELLLPRNGIYILENVHTEAVVKHGVYEFLFVLAVPRFRGSVQMAANPVAVF